MSEEKNKPGNTSFGPPFSNSLLLHLHLQKLFRYRSRLQLQAQPVPFSKEAYARNKPGKITYAVEEGRQWLVKSPFRISQIRQELARQRYRVCSIISQM